MSSSTSSRPILSNRQWLYKSAPTGIVGPENYEITTTQLDCNELGGTEAIIQVKFWTCDPYMRTRQSSHSAWTSNSHPLGKVQEGGTVGQVLFVGKEVKNVAVGDFVHSFVGWQEYARVSATTLTKLSPPTDKIPASTALGVLGMPGRTAWFGLTDVGKPKPEDVLVVSGAAGAVGLLVAQIGLRSGCRVIGIAGSKEKCDLLTKEYKLHAALNYKEFNTAEKFKKELEKLAPNGVDIYFDNTGGHVTDAIMTHLAMRARIIVCGQISQYNDDPSSHPQGPRFLHQLIYKRAVIAGILASDYNHRSDEQFKALRPLLESGDIKLPETVMDGFEKLPEALRGLFEGANVGKMIVKAI